MTDPYATLGVPRGADADAIKSAYRKLAKANHPDRHPGDAKASDRFKAASSAYALLSDADKRAQYDRGEIDGDGNPRSPFAGGGRSGGGFRPGPGGQTFDFGGGDPAEMFADILGQHRAGFNARRPPPVGRDIAYRLTVPFVDAATLAPQRVTLGDGKTIELKLRPGFESGMTMRVGGKGEPGPGGAGDALVTLEVGQHPHFTRDGDDIRLDLPVSLAEAVLGAKVQAPTVDGPVTLTVPAGATSGRTLRLKGRGFTRVDGTRGDQFVRLAIDLPADDAELRDFARAWATDRERNPRAQLGVN